MLTLVSDEWRQGDSDAAEPSDDERAWEAAVAEELTARAFERLSLREAATRTLGC